MVAHTKKKIMQAFWSLYCQNPIHKITVREIITLADCNRSTFYAHFFDVYDVLGQWENLLLPNVDQPALQRLINENDIQLSVEHCMALYKRYKDYYVVLLGEQGDPNFQQKLKQIFARIIKAHLSITKETTAFELDFLIDYTASTLISMLTFYYACEDRPPAKEIIALIVELINNGLSNKLHWRFSVKPEK